MNSIYRVKGMARNISDECSLVMIGHPRGYLIMTGLLGVLSLTKKYGPASVDEACAAALEVGVSDYHFVRRYLERNPQLPLGLRQVDPLIRQLTLYRDFIQNKTKESEK